jgi:hypothetical protein
MRTRDTRILLGDLDTAIADYETYSTGLLRYGVHLRWWIARYSRGDGLEALRSSFATLARKVEASAKRAREENGADHALFGHGPTDLEMFRDALVLLSMALCLRVPHEQVQSIANACRRGDALMEMLVKAASADLAAPATTRAFPEEFAELYQALEAAPSQRAALIARYLQRWPEMTRQFGFRIAEQKLGYWCFEAAGLAAALGVDDSSFADDPHYPRDLADYHHAR